MIWAMGYLGIGGVVLLAHLSGRRPARWWPRDWLEVALLAICALLLVLLWPLWLLFMAEG